MRGRTMTLSASASVSRYLRIVRWAQSRYTRPDAFGHMGVATFVGGRPTRFTKIEDMTASAYLQLSERYPGLRLCDCNPQKIGL